MPRKKLYYDMIWYDYNNGKTRKKAISILGFVVVGDND